MSATQDVHEGRTTSTPTAARRAAWAGFFGSFIEYFDFALYGILTVYFAPLFFPAADNATSLLAGLAVFGAGFVARPLGGVVFGRIGDRQGRRTALLATILLMGLCSGLVGVLPTYETIGVLAPVLLVVLRLGQGLSAGSEVPGAVTFVSESAPPERRAFLTSLTPFGSVLGGLSGGLLVAVLAALLPAATMSTVGWRIPFLLTVPLTIAAFLFRRRLEDSPEFAAMKRSAEIVRSPLRETLRRHGRRLAVAACLAIGVNGVIGLIPWFSTFLAGNRGLPITGVLLAASLPGMLVSVLVPVSGRLGGRFGYRRVMAVVLGVYVVAAFPILLVLSTTTSVLVLCLAFAAYTALCNLLFAPTLSYTASLFPRNVRYTAATLGQNAGTVLGSGIAPLMAGLLLLATGTGIAVTIWVVGMAAIALAALWAGRGLAPAMETPSTTDGAA